MNSKRPKISAAIFDIGMVLLKFDFKVSVKRMENRCKTPPAEMLETLWKSGLVKLYEIGKIDTNEFARKGAQMLGFDGADAEFMEAWTNIFTPNDPMIERVRRWKKRGMPLYLISNTCEAHIAFFKSQYDVFDLFDGEVYSCREGLAKPERLLYERALTRYNLDPQATIFIDDLLENVVGARATKIQGVHYQDESTLVTELRKFELD
jgi:FMN phosphatase YigB (HAD superfamily)